MADDYVFIDSTNDVQKGKENLIQGWTCFFDQFPDYVNHFSALESKDDFVLVVGHSTCSHHGLNGPALWTARVKNNLIAEWRIYKSTPENRERLKEKFECKT
jgi:predicted SnoaL-like aldol condensation-catalyzing enzyme